MKKYTICVVKATRPAKFIEGGLEFEHAVVAGEDMYQAIRILQEYMVSGVAVVIVADEDFEKFLTDRHSWGKLTAYQFGSY